MEFLLESNRYIHMFVSFGLMFTLKLLIFDKVFVGMFVFCVGMFKEFSDPFFDAGDIFANCLGIIIGALL